MGLLSWLGMGTVGDPVKEGDPAPESHTSDEHGKDRHLTEFYNDGYTLFFFYPMADSPGCTMQACSLRDGFDELKALGITIVGVSADSPESQFKFQEKYHLPFTLLSDKDRTVAQAFGVPNILGMTSRQSFLIKGRKVVWRDLRASTRWQTRDVIAAVNKLEGRDPSLVS